jgi:hypothetical protein
MTNDKAREEFETWAREKGYDLGRYRGTDRYKNPFAQESYLAWQAATAAERERIVTLLDEIGAIYDEDHGIDPTTGGTITECKMASEAIREGEGK